MLWPCFQGPDSFFPDLIRIVRTRELAEDRKTKRSADFKGRPACTDNTVTASAWWTQGLGRGRGCREGTQHFIGGLQKRVMVQVVVSLVSQGQGLQLGCNVHHLISLDIQRGQHTRLLGLILLELLLGSLCLLVLLEWLGYALLLQGLGWLLLQGLGDHVGWHR